VSFVSEFNALPLTTLLQRSLGASTFAARASLGKAELSLSDFAHLISPAGAELLEPLSRRSRQMTQQRFGKVIRLFAPLYLSNECINACKYCGNILLVSGEHPKFVSTDYMAQCVSLLHEEVPSLSLEIGPMETEEYRPIMQAGAEGLVVYQETYDRAVYTDMHTAGPKRNFEWRMETPERAYAAGFRRIGIGALYGLGDWRFEALSVAAHAAFLLRNCWKAQLTISLPRLRPCAGEFQPLTHLSDRELVQLVCAFRLMFPDVGLVLSTRESAKLRNGLIPLGITLISAGSHTEPGGYTGAGKDKLHHTERGKIVELGASEWATPDNRPVNATSQFQIADERSAREVADLIRQLGYEPVWKDWDMALTG
jgi:2-iminoacetate synthase